MSYNDKISALSSPILAKGITELMKKGQLSGSSFWSENFKGQYETLQTTVGTLGYIDARQMDHILKGYQASDIQNFDKDANSKLDFKRLLQTRILQALTEWTVIQALKVKQASWALNLASDGKKLEYVSTLHLVSHAHLNHDLHLHQ